MNKKSIYVVGILIFIISLTACANQQYSETPKTVTVGFELPDSCSQSTCSKPRQFKGQSTVELNSGDFFEVEVPNGSGAMLLIIQDENKTPFKNGQFVVRLASGEGIKKKLEIAEGVEGSYKYMILDVSGNDSVKRPPLDPVIIIRR